VLQRLRLDLITTQTLTLCPSAVNCATTASILQWQYIGLAYIKIKG